MSFPSLKDQQPPLTWTALNSKQEILFVMQVGVWHAFPPPFDWQEIIGPSAVFKQLADGR